MSKLIILKEELIDLQELVFIEVAKKINERLPDSSLKITVPNSEINSDLTSLKDRGFLAWDASLKFWLFCDVAESHPIKLAVYYRGLPVGFAIGGYNAEANTTEISLLEKRTDCHSDLYKQFLPIVTESFAAYSLALSIKGIHPEKIAITNPLASKIPYYTNSGMRFESNYYKGMSAMILDYQGVL